MPRTKLIITMERDIPVPEGGFTRLRAQRLVDMTTLNAAWNRNDQILGIVDALEASLEEATNPKPD